jgi:membrane AbrB-like protein
MLLGPLAATLTAALAGFPLSYPLWVQGVVLAIIGINVGGSLTADSVAQAQVWLPSIAGEIVALLGSLVVGSLIMRWVAGQSTATAFLASYPGHLVMVLTAAAQGRADERVVAMVQSLRLVVLVAAIPLLFAGGMATVPDAPLPPFVPLDSLVVVVAGLLGIVLSKAARLPTPVLTGSLIGAATAALLGFSLGPVPHVTGDWLLVVVGGMIGARFAGTSRGALFASIPVCALTVAAMLLTVAAVAWPMSTLLGVPFAQVLLAYSPGGADVMPLIALTQGHDAVFVGIHHGARLILMALVLPMAAPLYAARP